MREERRELAISFDRIADRYDATRSYPDDVMALILRVLDDELDGRGPILDAGAGTGRYLVPLSGMGYEVVGIDISTLMLAKAWAKGGRNLIRADVNFLPFADGVFEATLSIHMLHLIKTWKRALEEIVRVTRGRLISVSTDHRESPAEEIRTRYEQACEELGFKVQHQGMRERELSEVLRPDKERHITTYERPLDVATRIDGFEARTYSSQWFVPEDIHREAIAAIREYYAGVDQMVDREKVTMIVWDADRIGQFVKGPEAEPF